MHFEISEKNKKYKGSRLQSNIFSFTLLAVALTVITQINIDGKFQPDFRAAGFILICFVLSVLLFLSKQRSIGSFDVDDSGIIASNKHYGWSEMARYHILGDALSERSAQATRFQNSPNPYKSCNTQIFKIRLKNKFCNSHLNLEIDKEKVEEFMDVLAKHDITKTSKWRHWLGVN
jgi:hypothetical protein